MESIHGKYYKLIIDRLVEARREAKMTQHEVARIWGKSQPTIAKLESCERRLDVMEFLEVCMILNANPNEIISCAHTAMKSEFFKR